ncbi:T9SS type A sorting domain-containing protein [Brumimicrobium aurantiacum]|uniref:T9SS C-terminal target domain-containing protein n=1 Tax=Brumimicrobium aurantiacum TaxID=1737063 RepID=A0A3E1EXR3_9FLAO|nr:T9SS type A sorting domain-containing protein [Brumimicrobium aurantiacum]RFC54328.1 T9SS C-terminal target domain-containing protein [Brumimicrobium aurantiacum]
MITNTENKELNVDVYDIHGRLIKQVYEGKPSAKQIELKVNTSSFANGIYFYHVLLGKHSENIKFIKN